MERSNKLFSPATFTIKAPKKYESSPITGFKFGSSPNLRDFHSQPQSPQNVSPHNSNIFGRIQHNSTKSIAQPFLTIKSPKPLARSPITGEMASIPSARKLGSIERPGASPMLRAGAMSLKRDYSERYLKGAPRTDFRDPITGSVKNLPKVHSGYLRSLGNKQY